MRYFFVLIFCCGVYMVFGQKDTVRRVLGKISYRIDSSLVVVNYKDPTTNNVGEKSASEFRMGMGFTGCQ
jgi:hypothetical protein